MSMNSHPSARKQDLRRTPAAGASQPSATAGNNAKTGGGNPDDIRINGFEQVLAMMDAADPAFRESLLRRLAQRDPLLVKQLRLKLGI